MKLIHIFFTTLLTFYTTSTLSTLVDIFDLEKRKPKFIEYATSIQDKMNKCGNATLLYYAVRATRGVNDAYGALVARPFFMSNLTQTINENLTRQKAFDDIDCLWGTINTYAQLHINAFGFDTVEKDINIKIIHPYTCKTLGFDPLHTSVQDLSKAIDENQVDRQAYNHAMVCSQFVRYLLKEEYKKQ